MKIDYDKIADVLYIAIKDRPGIADEVSSGNFIRYGAGDGEIVGITIMDFKERFINTPDTGNLPPCDVPGRACEGCEWSGKCPVE